MSKVCEGIYASPPPPLPLLPNRKYIALKATESDNYEFLASLLVYNSTKMQMSIYSELMEDLCEMMIRERSNFGTK